MKKTAVTSLVISIFMLVSEIPHSSVDAYMENYAGNVILDIYELEFDHFLPQTFDNNSNYLSGWDSISSPILAHINPNGTISLLVDPGFNSNYVYIYELDDFFRISKTLRINKELPLFGGFTKDDQGYYYLLFGKNLEESQKDEAALLLVKYNSEGKTDNTLSIIEHQEDSYWGPGYWGVKEPFVAGNCKMVVGNGILAVYTSRLQFKSSVDNLNHQASFGFMVDTKEMNLIDDLRGKFTPSAGHSFDQFICFDGKDFLFADQADYSPRGFVFTKRSADGNSFDSLINRINSFPFKEGPVYQYTFAQMGSVAIDNGNYLFLAASEKNNYLDPNNHHHNQSRNLFLQVIEKDLTSSSDPLWLTNYLDRETENAAYPGLIKMGDGPFIILWEKHLSDNQGHASTSHVKTFGAILSSYDTQHGYFELPYARLSHGGNFYYNHQRDTVTWIGSDSEGFYIYELRNPLKDFVSANIQPIAPALLSPGRNDSIIDRGTLLTWLPRSNATKYEISIYNLKTGDLVHQEEVEDVTAFELPDLKGHNVEYQWAVKAGNTAGWSASSVSRTFIDLRYKLGDVNNDGAIDVQDVVLTMRQTLNLSGLNEQQKLAADVNGDGAIDVNDVVLIMRYSLGLIESF